MIKLKLILLVLSLFTGVFSTAVVGAADALSELWKLEGVFEAPESAAYDPRRDQVFVSNVNGYAKDGNGFISLIGGDGSGLKKKWLSDLNSPTGLAVQGDTLYAVDFDQLLIIDIPSASIISRASSPDEKPSLNDVAVSPDGEVFVSGSSSATIYTLAKDKLEVWSHDKHLLKHANGLLVDGTKLVFGGTQWHVFDLKSKQAFKRENQLDPAVVEIDGITLDGCGGYLITLLDDDRIWQVMGSGQARPLSDQLIKGIDLDFVKGRLYVPVVGGGLTVFELKTDICVTQ